MTTAFYLQFTRIYNEYHLQINFLDDYEDAYILASVILDFYIKNFNLKIKSINDCILETDIDYLTFINIINYYYINKINGLKISDLKINDFKDFINDKRNSFFIETDINLNNLLPYNFLYSELILIDDIIEKYNINDFSLMLLQLTKDKKVKEKYDYLINANKFDLI